MRFSFRRRPQKPPHCPTAGPRAGAPGHTPVPTERGAGHAWPAGQQEVRGFLLLFHQALAYLGQLLRVPFPSRRGDRGGCVELRLFSWVKACDRFRVWRSRPVQPEPLAQEKLSSGVVPGLRTLSKPVTLFRSSVHDSHSRESLGPCSSPNWVPLLKCTLSPTSPIAWLS